MGIIFTCISLHYISSLILGHWFPQRWSYHAASLGKAETSKRKEDGEHQGCNDKGEPDQGADPQCQHQQQESGPREGQVHDEVCHAGEEDTALGAETGGQIMLMIGQIMLMNGKIMLMIG